VEGKTSSRVGAASIKVLFLAKAGDLEVNFA
jgi:hypothetical protein